MLHKNEKKVLLLKKHSHSKCVSYCTWPPEPQKIWVNFSQKKQSCLCDFWEYHLLQFTLLPWQRSGALSASREEYFLSVLLLQSGHYELFGNKQERKQPQQNTSAYTALPPVSRKDLEYLESLSSAEKLLQGVTQLSSEEQTSNKNPSACREVLGHNRKF